MRNKVEGVNRSRGEALETVHHLFTAKLKGYITTEVFEHHRARYKECVRMLNGLERHYEQQVPEGARYWPGASSPAPDDLDDSEPAPPPDL